MPRACLICYKLNFDEPSGSLNSPGTKGQNILIQYLQLIDNGTFQISFEKLTNAGMYSCNDCSKTLERIIGFYHIKKEIEIRLNSTVSKLERSMSLAQANSTRLETLRAGANNLGLSVEEIIKFSSDVIHNSGLKLKTTPAPLPTPPPGTSELDQSRTSETVTCQSSSSFPLDVQPNDYKSSPNTQQNSAATIEHTDWLSEWFKSVLADKLREEDLKKENELMNDNITQLTNPTAQAGNIPMQRSSLIEREIAASYKTGNFTYEDNINMNLDEVAPTLGDATEIRMPSDHLHPFVCGPQPPTTSEPIGNQFICDFCGMSFPNYAETQLHLLSCQNMDMNSASSYALNPIYPVPLATPALSNTYGSIPPTSTPVSDLEPQLQNEAENADEDSNLGTVKLPPFEIFGKSFGGSY